MPASNTTANPSLYPYDTVVRITDEIGGVAYQASGVLIAPDEVLTASHVVWQEGVGTATDIVVAPAYEDGSEPYGTATGVSFHYNAVDDANDEISLASSQSDFAVIHLSTDFNVGTMEIGSGYTGGTAQVTGYPADERGAQVDVTEAVSVNPQYAILDGTDIGAGSSGGPIWITGANGVPEIVGLVSSGSGRSGYFVQLTSADVGTIDSWVSTDNATATPPVIVKTSGPGTAETVFGAGLGTVTVFVPASIAPLTATTLAQISADMAAGALQGINAHSGVTPAAPAGGVEGELVIGSPGDYVVPAGFGAVINHATVDTALFDQSGANQTVVSGVGAISFQATGAAGGALIGAGDGSLLYTGADIGSWSFTLAEGANTIVAGGGNDTISAGSGGNVIFLGGGAQSVASTGADTILGGGGSATIGASGGGVLAFGVGSLTFVATGGASTVVAGASGATVQGGPGATVFFGAGASSFAGAGSADTVTGGAGSLTATGDGSALIFGGTAGQNNLTAFGADTLVGAGPGDTLSAVGSSSAVLAAGSGAELLNASGSSGNVALFAGSGADTLLAGSGTTALVAGGGNGTLVAGTGADDLVFSYGRNGASQVVDDFTAARDYIGLMGYGAGAAAEAVAGETTTSIGTTLVLSDGTHILFAGVSSLSVASFT